MIAFCQKCGQLIRGRQTADVGLTGEQKAAARIQDFDSLAAAMLGHINERHTQPETGAASSAMQELSAVMYLAGKVYAMSLAQSTDDEHFEALREAWRAAIMATVFPRAYADGTAAPAGESTGPAES
jgi:hypothetical protein